MPQKLLATETPAEREPTMNTIPVATAVTADAPHRRFVKWTRDASSSICSRAQPASLLPQESRSSRKLDLTESPDATAPAASAAVTATPVHASQRRGRAGAWAGAGSVACRSTAAGGGGGAAGPAAGG